MDSTDYCETCGVSLEDQEHACDTSDSVEEDEEYYYEAPPPRRTKNAGDIRLRGRGR